MSTHVHHQEKHCFYFVTFTCYQWLPLLEKSEIYDFLPAWICEIKKRGVLICGYVFMPNHIHLLVFVQENSKGLNHIIGEAKRFLAYEIVSRLKSKNELKLLYKLVQGVQEKERGKGKKHQVFRLSFDAKEVKGKDEIDRILDYMHHNPVSGKWHLVDDFTDFEYSSARYYELGEPRDITISHYLDTPRFSEFPTDNSEGE